MDFVYRSILVSFIAFVFSFVSSAEASISIHIRTPPPSPYPPILLPFVLAAALSLFVYIILSFFKAGPAKKGKYFFGAVLILSFLGIATFAEIKLISSQIRMFSGGPFWALMPLLFLTVFIVVVALFIFFYRKINFKYKKLYVLFTGALAALIALHIWLWVGYLDGKRGIGTLYGLSITVLYWFVITGILFVMYWGAKKYLEKYKNHTVIFSFFVSLTASYFMIYNTDFLRGIPEDLFLIIPAVEKEFKFASCMQEPIEKISNFASAGNLDAQLILGSYYDSSHEDGMRWDSSRAEKWFMMSANQGYNYAQQNLGKLYSEGYEVEGIKGFLFDLYDLGVKKDYEKAYFWLNLGSDCKGGWIQKYCEIADSKLSTEQKTAIKEQIAAWKPQEVRDMTDVDKEKVKSEIDTYNLCWKKFELYH